jgi:threonine dehydratase
MISLEDIRAAARRIHGRVHHTPVFTSRLFNQAAGVQCWFKCENLQRAGAFKIRGAMNFLLSLTAAERRRGVVAFSSGNHAQAVALAALELGIPAAIVMPQDAPAVKREATLAYGAEVVFYDRRREDREAIGRQIAQQRGAILVPPFDHEWIIAGQGTAALELVEEVPDLDTLVVCIGGGGLIAGSAVAAQGRRVIGVEPERANDTWLSLRAGQRVEIPTPDTVADGLRATSPGKLTFPIVQRLVETVLLVSEEEILQTARFIHTRMKLVVEPSGAVAAAAVLHRKLSPACRRVGIILSGGNC